jgi:DNA mismatch repair protein MutH
MHLTITPPASQEALLQRAQRLAGKTIGQVAADFDYSVPQSLRRKKGWQGQFIEQCLGADSGNLSQPDFAHLGIELKTLPIDYYGRVQESTYVCVLNLTGQQLLRFEDSPVYHKLQQVLWVPIARNKGESVLQSRIATPFLWRANAQQLTMLRQDWENAVELVNLGQVDKLTARQGDILQVRPKAANSRALTQAIDRDGKSMATLPRGFYLRPTFTQQILRDNLHLC